MKLEQQVTSRELSERLRDLGVKEESYFKWAEEKTGGWNVKDWHWVITDDLYEGDYNQFRNITSAFTVAELGELFPPKVQLPFKRDAMTQEKGWFEKWYYSTSEGRIEADNEAEARGLMLVYLLENKIITL